MHLILSSSILYSDLVKFHYFANKQTVSCSEVEQGGGLSSSILYSDLVKFHYFANIQTNSVQRLNKGGGLR
jgi:hypothetical protein